jgi:hypothetical protein
LIGGIVQAVISHPVELLADRAVDLMARHACQAEERDQLSQVIVLFKIFIPESL